jgi:hypothetical protein
MRFGNLRGVTLALGWAPALALAACLSSTAARAQDFHTIPRLVPAIDLNTGGPYYAPPIPYGHYAGKNYAGRVCGRLRGLLHGGCGHCGGKGCGACGGGKGCGLCGGAGCDACGGGHGGGLFGKHKGAGLGGCGLCGGAGCGACTAHASTVVASAQGGPVVMPAPQGPVVEAGACGDAGCGLFGKHRHKGCGDPCGGCGGKGCGLCKGGKGCGLCRGLVGRLLGHNRIDWFTGPGGPVPLTPGYVPYVNATRSPRDFLAFPPFTP